MKMKKIYTLLLLALFGMSGAVAQTSISPDGKTVVIELNESTDITTRITDDGSEFNSKSVHPTLATLRGIERIKINAELEAIEVADPSFDANQVETLTLTGTGVYTFFDLLTVRSQFPNLKNLSFVGAELDAFAFNPLYWESGAYRTNATDKYDISVFTHTAATPYGLVSVVFDENTKCERVGYKAFSNISTLNHLILPKNLTSIGELAFTGTTSLTEVTIPADVTYISANSFSAWAKVGPSSKRDFYFEGVTPPATIEKTTFSGNASQYKVALHVPVGSVAAYEAKIKTMSDYGYAAARYSIVEENPTSIGESEADIVSVYPNPTVDVVNVNGFSGAQKQVYDSMGRLVIQTVEDSFNLSDQTAGVYLIKVEGQTVKVIKK